MDDCLIDTDESDPDNVYIYQEITHEDSVEDEWYEPEEEKYHSTISKIPLNSKIKVVTLARRNPSWSLKSLQSKGSKFLKRKVDIVRWEKQIIEGGTIFDKYEAIDQWTYDRFKEARQNLQQVTTRQLQQWSLAGANQYVSNDFIFTASTRWVSYFKNKYQIRQRKVTKYVSFKEIASLDETIEAAEKFRKIIKFITPQFNTKYNY